MKKIKVNGIEIKMPNERVMYSFTIKSIDFIKFSSVKQARRDEEFSLVAYQRPEVKAHILEIAKYLARGDAILPNAIVISLDPQKINFEHYQRQGSGIGSMGELTISYEEEIPSAWIIDGQQRTQALREAKLLNFPIFVTAFAESDENVQRQQFVNVNSSKPLPSALINELLPHLEQVPAKFSKKALPSAVAEILATDKNSPFFGLVKLATMNLENKTKPVVEFNSLVLAIANCAKNKNSFIRVKFESGGVKQIKEVAENLILWWKSVKVIFPNAWGKLPKESRLMHGAGIWVMTHLADHVARCYGRWPAKEEIVKDQTAIRDHVAWTLEDEKWENIDGVGYDMKWNEIQNTAAHKNLLANYIIRKWEMARGGKLCRR
jgi:DGQHR domain-containing protein